MRRLLVLSVVVLSLGYMSMDRPVRSAEATLPALYEAAQATRGKASYAASCASCHGKGLVGGGAPALTGPQFFTKEMNTKLAGVFQYMAREMPQGRPGSLTHDQYADLMAFILEMNGFPSGSVSLSYESALSSNEILYFAK
jgi:polar amino acid transport system substrate-binding protein